MAGSRTILIWCCLYLHAAGAAVAASVPAQLTPCGSVVISSAVDGETLLGADGKTIKLISVKAPELWPKENPYRSWPFAEQARAILNARVAGKTVRLFCEGEQSDVRGALLAHVVMENGDWLQDMMVAAGAVYVFPRRDHMAGLASLYRSEDKARALSNGMWRLNRETITQAQGEVRTGWFQIVGGVVAAANAVNKTIFLNFGDDWRKDFTVEISPRAHAAFKRAGLNPLSWQGKPVEVRGWVTWKGGPHIMLEGPSQIRLKDNEN